MREEAEADMRSRVGEPVGLADMAEAMAECDPRLH